MKIFYYIYLLFVNLFMNKNNVPKHSLKKQETKKFKFDISPMTKMMILVLIASVFLAIIVFTFVPPLDSGAWYRQIYLK